jgi:hypothetical protein
MSTKSALQKILKRVLQTKDEDKHSHECLVINFTRWEDKQMKNGKESNTKEIK